METTNENCNANDFEDSHSFSHGGDHSDSDHGSDKCEPLDVDAEVDGDHGDGGSSCGSGDHLGIKDLHISIDHEEKCAKYDHDLVTGHENNKYTILRDEQGIMNYSNHHKILVVGEPEDDFSFAASLAKSFGSASDVVATSPDSQDAVLSGYSEAKKNLRVLEELGTVVLHQTEAHSMNKHPQLQAKLFDRIVFSFPRSESIFNPRQDGSCYVECNQDVLRGFHNATKQMLAENGEIHVAHKTVDRPLDYKDLLGSVSAGAVDVTASLDGGFGEVAEEEECIPADHNNLLEECTIVVDDTVNTVENEKDNGSITTQERSIGLYSGNQKLLLVGEGDFSFSACLANAFGCASNSTATSLDSRDTVVRQYSQGQKNLSDLEDRGADVIHQVDAHTMNEHPQLDGVLFDRIIYNFPHAGGHYLGVGESTSWYIECHRQVVRGFFNAARYMLAKDGEIHVTHKTANPFSRWNVEELAKEAGLMLTREAGFYSWDYPGYVNKKAYGFSWDSTFPVGECSTFIFRRES